MPRRRHSSAWKILQGLVSAGALIAVPHLAACNRGQQGSVGARQRSASSTESQSPRELRGRQQQAADPTKRDSTGRYPIVF
jgi:hypothetical protein